MKLSSWDFRFLEMAALVASWSKDPSTQVGAVIADEKNRVVSVGYNGFPRGLDDSEGLYYDRLLKYDRILHAEQNAIMFSPRRDLKGCTVYIHPIPPCSRCSLEIIQSGLSRVVSYGLTKDHDRWKESATAAQSLLLEAGVVVDLVEME